MSLCQLFVDIYFRNYPIRIPVDNAGHEKVTREPKTRALKFYVSHAPLICQTEIAVL